jgi:hypothetical protein
MMKLRLNSNLVDFQTLADEFGKVLLLGLSKRLITSLRLARKFFFLQILIDRGLVSLTTRGFLLSLIIEILAPLRVLGPLLVAVVVPFSGTGFFAKCELLTKRESQPKSPI